MKWLALGFALLLFACGESGGDDDAGRGVDGAAAPDGGGAEGVDGGARDAGSDASTPPDQTDAAPPLTQRRVGVTVMHVHRV